MRRAVVPELGDERMLVERALDDAALDAAAAAVHEAQAPEARGMRGANVFVDNVGNVARGEGVQIELGLDWDAVGISVHASRQARGPAPGANVRAIKPCP